VTDYCLTKLLKPRGRSSEALSEYIEYILSIEHEHVRLGVPPIGGFYCWSFHGNYDAFLVA
jgi:hypothetical protein